MNQYIQIQKTTPLSATKSTIQSYSTPSKPNHLQKNIPLIPREEIEETYNLLRDFGINIRKSDIPRNITIFDLLLWRRARIKAYLQTWYTVYYITENFQLKKGQKIYENVQNKTTWCNISNYSFGN